MTQVRLVKMTVSSKQTDPCPPWVLTLLALWGLSWGTERDCPWPTCVLAAPTPRGANLWLFSGGHTAPWVGSRLLFLASGGLGAKMCVQKKRHCYQVAGQAGGCLCMA